MQVYWCEQAEAALPADDDWLSARELATMRALKVPKRRGDWRLGRWTAKHAVTSALQLPHDRSTLRKVEIKAAESGAPEVHLAGNDTPVIISISHRGGLAACAVTLGQASLGCDLELVEVRSNAFISDYFTAQERDLVNRAATEEGALLACLLWSAKESALKALQVGLRADTRSVVVKLGTIGGDSVSCEQWCPLVVRSADTSELHGWWRCEAGVIRTVVADPAPLQPVEIYPPS